MAFDAGVVDLFLHYQDKAFFVPEVLDLIEASGLVFQSWLQNRLYYPDAYGALTTPEIQSRLSTLPEREQWTVVEKLSMTLAQHRFVATSSRRSAASYLVDFSDDASGDYRPTRNLAMNVRDVGRGNVELQLGHSQLTLTGREAEMFRQRNGAASVAEIAAGDFDLARAFFARMWRLGILFFLR